MSNPSWLTRAWTRLWSPSFWPAAAGYESPGDPERPIDSPPNISVGSGPVVRNLDDVWPTIGERRALGQPALWRCVHIVAGAVAAMPIHAYRDLERVEPASRLLTEPSPTRPRSHVWHQMMEAVLMHGNGVAILSEPDRLGYPTRLRPVHPLRMWAREVDGEIEEYRYYPRRNGDAYGYPDTSREPRRLSPTEVLHIRGLTLPGDAWGIGILEAMQSSLALADYLKAHARGWFEGAAVPSGIIKIANPNPSDEEVEDAKHRWMERFAGRAPEPVVLPGDVDFRPLGTTPESTQLLQSRQYSGLEMALMFGIPARMIEAQQPGRSLTYSNTEQEGIEFVRWTLLYWMTQIEEALTPLLPGVQYTRFNVDSLLRTTTLDRYRAHQMALGDNSRPAWLTLNEVRQLEGREPMWEVEEDEDEAESEAEEDETTPLSVVEGGES